MRVIRRICAVLLGFVFFIAGILKLMDPVGAALVVEEYLKFFHLDFLHFGKDVIACALALIETLLGAGLITGVWRRIIAWISLGFLGFFTIITAILWIYNPPMDCGCFSEAIHLSHSATFFKNLILLFLWAASFVPFRTMEPTRKIKYISFSISSISVCLFLLYSLFSLPLIEFGDFRPGAELEDSQTVLSFSNVSSEYVDSLAYNPKTLIISVYDTDKIDSTQWDKISSTLHSASENGYTALLLLSARSEEVFNDDLLPYCYFADRKTLMTLNRSNGGASYLSDGQVIAKWPVHKLPKEETLIEYLASDSVDTFMEQTNASNLKMQGFLLYVFAVMLLL